MKISLNQVFGTYALDAIETPKTVVPIQDLRELMFTFNLTAINSQTSAAEYLFVRESCRRRKVLIRILKNICVRMLFVLKFFQNAQEIFFAIPATSVPIES